MDIEVIEIDAESNHDFGFCLGLATKAGIKKQISSTHTLHVAESEAIKQLYDEYLHQISSAYPQYLDELRGMAEGADVDFRQLLKLNLPELRKSIKKELKKDKEEQSDSCTTLVLHNDECVIAHNEDGPPTQDIFVLKARLPSGTKVLCTVYYGVLPGLSANINDAGLFFSCNTLTANDQRRGVPKRFFTRHAIEARTYKEFMSIIENTRRASGLNMVVAWKNKIKNIELSATGHYVKEITKNFSHANNYLLPKMIRFEGRKHRDYGSFIRTRYTQEQMRATKTTQQLIQILSSHENSPSCVCAHGKDVVNKTLGAILYSLKKPKTLRVAYGPTCKAKFHDYTL